MGVDLVEEALFASVGIPCRPHVRDIPPHAIAYCFINAKKSGKLKNLDFLQPFKNADNIVSVTPQVAAGDTVVCPEDGLPTWLAEIVVKKGSSKEALDYIFEIQDKMDKEALIV